MRHFLNVSTRNLITVLTLILVTVWCGHADARGGFSSGGGFHSSRSFSFSRSSSGFASRSFNSSARGYSTYRTPYSMRSTQGGTIINRNTVINRTVVHGGYGYGGYGHSMGFAHGMLLGSILSHPYGYSYYSAPQIVVAPNQYGYSGGYVSGQNVYGPSLPVPNAAPVVVQRRSEGEIAFNILISCMFVFAIIVVLAMIIR